MLTMQVVVGDGPVHIGEDILVHVTSVHGPKVRLGFEAPGAVQILRHKLFLETVDGAYFYPSTAQAMAQQAAQLKKIRKREHARRREVAELMAGYRSSVAGDDDAGYGEFGLRGSDRLDLVERRKRVGV